MRCELHHVSTHASSNKWSPWCSVRGKIPTLLANWQNGRGGPLRGFCRDTYKLAQHVYDFFGKQMCNPLHQNTSPWHCHSKILRRIVAKSSKTTCR